MLNISKMKTTDKNKKNYRGKENKKKTRKEENRRKEEEDEEIKKSLYYVNVTSFQNFFYKKKIKKYFLKFLQFPTILSIVYEQSKCRIADASLEMKFII